MKSREQRHRLFCSINRDAQANGLVAGSDEIVCPLCFEPTVLDNCSLEHVVPGSAGGKRLTLTCEQCNNEAGRKIDFHLSNYLATTDAVKSEGTVRATITKEGIRVAANVKLGADAIDVFPCEKATNPAHLSKFNDQTKTNQLEEFKLTIFPGYSPTGFRSALIRAAYLSMFDRLGYAYSNHHSGRLVAKYLQSLDPKFINSENVVFQLSSSKTDHLKPYAIINAIAGKLHTKLVILRTKKSTETIFAVFLPNNCTCSEHYSKLTQNKWLEAPFSLSDPPALYPKKRG